MRQAEEKVRADYGFVPDPALSIRQNARQALGDTPAWHCFSSPNHLAFHDLTPEGTLPPATRTVLGLSGKFVPIPAAATTRKKAMECFERFERDLGWKVHFAGDDDGEFIKNKLYVKSKAQPPLPLPTLVCEFLILRWQFGSYLGAAPG